MINTTGAAADVSAEPSPHRNQFALGRGVSAPKGWASLDLGVFGTLATHPSLSVTQAQGHGQQLVLVGDVFDWQRPSESNQGLLARLATENRTKDELLTATAELGGRWVLLRICANEGALFHDATGLRAVCYAMDSDGFPAAASDQGMLARIAHLPVDRASMAFAEAFSQRVSQWWLPGDALLFEGGRQLLPNHVLDMRTGTASRFWPSGEPTGDAKETLLERCAGRLEGTIAAAARRYPLALGLSAGWDSRLVLAFCRDIRDDLQAYSTVAPGRGGLPADTNLPTGLCETLGIRHERLMPATHASSDFSRAFREHVYQPLLEFEPYMETELAFSGCKKAGVTGNIAEIVKLPYEGKTGEQGFDDRNPEHLARLVRMQGFEYAATALARWRISAAESPRITIPELLYWENRCGRWLSRNALMFDIGWREIIMPFNCRALLSDFLEISADLRRRPDCLAFESLIRQRWPEVLSVPVVSKARESRSRRLWTQTRQSLRRLLRPGARKPG
jgi:hypothetical protein